MKIYEFFFLSCLLNLTLLEIIKSEPVLDTNKEEVRPGKPYYILPATTGKVGGGLTLAKGENGSCPLDVFQARNPQSVGLPVKFLMVNSSAGLIIDENEDVNIKFAAPRYVSICSESTVWKIEDGLVTTGGVKGSENGTSSCLFTIQKYEDAYALQYCPRAAGCSFICPRLLCRYVGILPAANGSRRLAVNRPVFKIVFKKA